MTIDEVMDAYIKLSPLIFKKAWWKQSKPRKLFGAETEHCWFDSKNLDEFMKAILGGQHLPAGLNLKE